MAAKAILSAKPNSFLFEDRVIVLEVPAKIGRSHKDDQVRNGELNNGHVTNRYIFCLLFRLSIKAHQITMNHPAMVAECLV